MNEHAVAGYRARAWYSPRDWHWIAEAQALPGCVADGATEQQAVDALRAAVAAWIAFAAGLGRDVPPPDAGGTIEEDMT